MKCPKCNYVSFDHNDACPKCGNALATERDEMNLPRFKPDPPFLLGTLIGSDDGTSVETAAQVPDARQADQEELMANLDELAAAYSEREAPEAEELTFDIEPEPPATKSFEIDTPSEPAVSDDVKLDLSFDEPGAADIGTLEFDIEPEQPEIDAIGFDEEPEKAKVDQNEARTQIQGQEADDSQIDIESPERTETPIEFELDRALSEDQISGDSVWDTEALEKKMAEIEEKTPAPSSGAAPKEKAGQKTDEFVIELDEVEPLELEIQAEDSDKKDR
ncbi:MAG: hypothetical protein P8165_08890 [Deltaproteobacteria bacterium]